MPRSDNNIAGKTRKYFRTILLVSLALAITVPTITHTSATSGPTYGYSRQWGSFGGPSAPIGVAVDPLGNLYVTDSQNYAVGKLSHDGTLLGLIGGPSQFTNPFGIALDNARNAMYVTDSVRNTVYRFQISDGSLVASWTSDGTTPGRLHAPLGIAVNSTGYVYVVDSGNQRVGIWNGNPTIPAFTKYFTLGTPGNFTMPVGIAIDPQGFVFLDDDSISTTDPFAGNITMFTKNGALASSWQPTQSPLILGPQGLAVDNASSIFLVDNFPGAQRVDQFNTVTHKAVKFWGTTGTSPGQFSNPIGIAVDGNENVFVGDQSNFNVLKFSGVTGTYLNSLAYQRTGLFSTPAAEALDSSGYLYIADQDNDRVQKFVASTGTFLSCWGTCTNQSGLFNGPAGIAVDKSGKVYVTDSGNARVEKFYPNGTLIKVWNVTGGINGAAVPQGIAADSTNHIYVTDSNNNVVDKYDSSGTLVQQWNPTGNQNLTSPQALAIDSSDIVYVVDSGHNRVEKFTSSGTFIVAWGSQGLGNGQFTSPGGITVDQVGNIFVADTYNARVEMFAANLTFLTNIVGSGSNQMINPTGVVVDSSDSVYVTDTNQATPGTTHNRVEVFAPSTDVAASKPSISRNTAYAGISLVQPVKINVTVTNLGLLGQTFWVKTFANSTVIGQQNVTLASGQSLIVTFPWQPNLLARATYNVTARVQNLAGEPNYANNVVQEGLFYVRLKGDVNADCHVDISDLVIVAASNGLTPSSPKWNPTADLNNDGNVDISDIVFVAQASGSSCP